MLTYHFTQDGRFTFLEQNLKSAANYIEYDVWAHPEQSYDQANNGWLPLYKDYFGLYKGSNNNRLILDGRSEEVIVEYLKKHQYPHPRTPYRINTMEKQIENEQLLAPLRTLTKLLFYLNSLEKKPEITIVEFNKYILNNERVAKNEASIADIALSLENHEFENSPITYEIYGAEEKRFAKGLIGMVKSLPFLNVERDNICLVTVDLSRDQKQMLFDVLIYDEFWYPDKDAKKNLNHESYREYMQVSHNFSIQEERASYFLEKEAIHNLIYYGAPGTGKSYEVNQRIKTVYPDFENLESPESRYVFRTTLHPEFTYTDFIGQIMPKIVDDKTVFDYNEGIFTQALKKALLVEKDKRPVFLVLEELSRADAAAVFGDIFQLLDRQTGISEYPINNVNLINMLQKDGYLSDIEKIYLPENLYIYCTVNTSDQNVFVMDTAFKRRFTWKYISTKPVNEENNPKIKIIDTSGKLGFIQWHDLYMGLNDYITKIMDLGEDKQIGQFFIKFKDDDLVNHSMVQDKLLQYLWEDIEKISFNNVALFDDNVKNFSELHTRFLKDEKIFSDHFLRYLEEKIFYEKSATNYIVDLDFYSHEEKLLLKEIEEELENISSLNDWDLPEITTIDNTLKYLVGSREPNNVFFEIQKNEKNAPLIFLFSKEYIEDIDDSYGDSEQKDSLRDPVIINDINDFINLKSHIEAAWSFASENE